MVISMYLDLGGVQNPQGVQYVQGSIIVWEKEVYMGLKLFTKKAVSWFRTDNGKRKEYD